jgi:DNA invertase Pin-like site-specific DNA recombinase
MGKTAVYARVSTDRQSHERQIQECLEFIDNDAERESAEVFADIESGAQPRREGVDQLVRGIEDGEITKVVTWEFSRIARDLTFGIEFIDLCIENSVEIVTVNDIFPHIHGDGDVMDEMIGKFVAWMMDFNRQMTIERVRSGVRKAINEGKWVGRPPYGFETDAEGYLVIKMDEYLKMQMAVEEVLLNPDQSVNSIARAYGVPQSSLDRIYKDEQRRKMYLYGDAADERLAAAVGEGTPRQSKLSSLEARLAELESKITAEE